MDTIIRKIHNDVTHFREAVLKTKNICNKKSKNFALNFNFFYIKNDLKEWLKSHWWIQHHINPHFDPKFMIHWGSRDPGTEIAIFQLYFEGVFQRVSMSLSG